MLIIIDDFVVWFQPTASEEKGPGYEVSLTQCKSDHADGKFLEVIRTYTFEINKHDKPAARQERAEDYIKRVGQALNKGERTDISIKENDNIHTESKAVGDKLETSTLTFTLWQAPEEEGGRRLQLLQKRGLQPSAAVGADLLALFARIQTSIQKTAAHEEKLRQLINDKNKALVDCTNDLNKLVRDKDKQLDQSLQGITLLFNAKKRQIAELQEKVAGPQVKASSLLQAAAADPRPLGATITTSSSSSSSKAAQRQVVEDIMAKNTIKRALPRSAGAAPAKRACSSKVKDEPASPIQSAHGQKPSSAAAAACVAAGASTAGHAPSPSPSLSPSQTRTSHTQRERENLSKMIAAESISGGIFGDSDHNVRGSNHIPAAQSSRHGSQLTQTAQSQAPLALQSSSIPLLPPAESSEFAPTVSSAPVSEYVTSLTANSKARSMYDSDSD